MLVDDRRRRCRRSTRLRARDWPRRLEVAHQLRHRQPLRFRQRRSEDRGDAALRRRRANARAKSSWNTRRHDEADRGSKTAQIRAVGFDARSAGQRFGDGGRMVREIVVDGHAVGDADDLEPALHAGERAQPLGDALDADRRPRSRRRSPPARCARCARRPAAPRTLPNGAPPRRTLNRVVPRRRLEVVRLPVDVRRRVPNVSHARHRRVRQRARARAVGADQQQSAPRHQVHEPPERQRAPRRSPRRCPRDRTRRC